MKKDEKKAAELYEKAANQGNRDALYCLGKMVYQGTGVQKEETNTFQLCMNRAQEHNFNIPVFDSSKREEIGRGSCGVVWRIQGEHVVRTENTCCCEATEDERQKQSFVARGASNA